jgi:hypothetical protein
LRFPAELWENEQEREMAHALAQAFSQQPLILTDRLANTVYFTPSAEALFHDRGEAIVNRLLFSLLGYGERTCIPTGLKEALLGEARPWRGVVHLGTGTDDPHTRVAEASAVMNGERFVCGVLRLAAERTGKQ